MGLANLRDWGGFVGRIGTVAGKRWVVCGVGWVRAGERVAREGDVFSGTGERMGRVNGLLGPTLAIRRTRT